MYTFCFKKILIFFHATQKIIIFNTLRDTKPIPQQLIVNGSIYLVHAITNIILCWFQN